MLLMGKKCQPAICIAGFLFFGHRRNGTEKACIERDRNRSALPRALGHMRKESIAAGI